MHLKMGIVTDWIPVIFEFLRVRLQSQTVAETHVLNDTYLSKTEAKLILGIHIAECKGLY